MTPPCGKLIRTRAGLRQCALAPEHSGDCSPCQADPPTELLTFFYLLVRDALPAGEVTRLVREAVRARGKGAAFTSAPLEQLARGLLAELVG